ncbi:hypothetical protein OGZ51_13355 [Lactococcus lactis]|uniref:Pectate lyase superfamily protein domain-containing protein n=1 Tax=Lactococcus lactis TaxID=1358 RepID=A0A9X4NJY1_9LACT|nr:hypothetical protein [Lactococcus lactis]MDG4985127.1 hypothetical protein [Lactococcus lactis]
MKKVTSQDIGIIADDDIDYTEKLNQYMSEQTEEVEIRFLPGRYRFESNIIAKNNISLFGPASDEIAVFFSRNGNAISLGADATVDINNYFKLRKIIFDNIIIRFLGENKKGIRIRCCAFINSKTPTNIDPNQSRNNAQLDVRNSSYDVRNNIFMRGKNFPGIGISTYKNTSTKLTGNFLGSFKDISKAKTYLESETLSLLSLMKDKSSSLNLEEDEGNFVSAWYATDELKDSTFTKNFISGNTLSKLHNPETDSEDIDRDHIIYIKHYNNVVISQNFFSGWPTDAHGQLKARNAENLVLVGNYLEQTSVNARAYKSSKNLFFRNTYILNNFISEGEINYYQDFVDSDSLKIDVKDFLVFGNHFKASNIEKTRIKGTPRNSSQEFYYTKTSNVYDDDNQKVVASKEFQDISEEVIKAKIPEEYQRYVSTSWIVPGSDV